MYYVQLYISCFHKNIKFILLHVICIILVQYQMEMMRKLREVNVDHLHVGWYQSTYLGSFLNKNFVEAQYNYQSSIEESVVLVYGVFTFFLLSC